MPNQAGPAEQAAQLPPLPDKWLVENLRVEITITCESGHVMGVYTGTCTAKYPLWCGQCEDTVEGKYPFTITTRIIPNGP